MFDFLTRWCNGKLLSALRVHGASLSVSSDTAVRRWTFMLKWSILSWHNSRFTAGRLLRWWSQRTARWSSHVSRLTSVRRFSWWLLYHRAIVASVFSNSHLLRETNRLVGGLFICRIVFMNVWSVYRVSSSLNRWKLASLRWSLLSGTFVRSTVNWSLWIAPRHHAWWLDLSINYPRLRSLFLCLSSESG